MKLGPIDFPTTLVDQVRNGYFVIFAGAGVSMGPPAMLPSFSKLASIIASGTGKVKEPDEPEDRFLGRLDAYGVKVHQLAAEALTKDEPQATRLHHDLLQLFRKSTDVRIVTTNFDLLFEQARGEKDSRDYKVYSSPALPLGSDFYGIVHLHGKVTDPTKMIITDADFGRSYLTEGWARQFLVRLFMTYPTLFVGYSHNDTVMNYLSRALPREGSAIRYALIAEQDDPQRWKYLGVEPIPYPAGTTDQHQGLVVGIASLARLVRLGALDLRREITDISAGTPPIDPGAQDLILDAFRDPIRIRYFTSAARAPEWLDWCEEQNLLEPLFRPSSMNDLSEICQQIAAWVAESFSIPCPSRVMLLLGKHRMRVHPFFWYCLERKITAESIVSIDNAIYRQWVHLLLESSPAEGFSMRYHSIAQRCQERTLLEEMLMIFEMLSGQHPTIKQDFSWSASEESSKTIQFNIDFSLDKQRHDLETLWSKQLQPHISQLAPQVFEICVRRIEERHNNRCIWENANKIWDTDNYRRSAIEPHEQDRYATAFDTLINAARDCLAWIANHQPDHAKDLINRCAKSDAPLLRRLAIHTVCLMEQVSDDKRLLWLLEQFDLHDVAIHHEVFRVVKILYAKASTKLRRKVIKRILAFRWPDTTEAENHEERITYEHYLWLAWLQGDAPDCEFLNREIERIRTLYPHFGVSEHPDLLHWFSGGWVGLKSPKSAEELLKERPSALLPMLLSFKGEDFFDKNRQGLLQEVQKASGSDFNWSYELAQALKSESDLWSGLIRSWSASRLGEEAYLRALELVGKESIRRTWQREVVDLLNSLVKDEKREYAPRLLPKANKLANTLWDEIDAAGIPTESEDWLSTAINHPAGQLALFWVSSLSVLRSSGSNTEPALSEAIFGAFTRVTEDKSGKGLLARCVLCSQLHFLLAIDFLWTNSNLAPLFRSSEADFEAAWDGLLTWGWLSPEAVAILHEPLEFAVVLLSSGRIHHLDQFVRFYTTVGVRQLEPDQLLQQWIPALFSYGSEEAWVHLAWHIDDQLNKAEDEERIRWWQGWLREYWLNRTRGKPATIIPEELPPMIGWLTSLHTVFEEAVGIAIQMPTHKPDHTDIIQHLSESDLPSRFPNAVARLLLYVDSTKPDVWIWHDAGKIFAIFEAANLDPELRETIFVLKQKLGL